MKKLIVFAVLAVMLAGCSGLQKVAKYTVCFGEEPEPCLAGYIEIAGPTLQGIK
jgi:uncharacterized protein YcfL